MEQTLETRIQVRDIDYLLQKLTDKFDPLQIYCFHKDEHSRKLEGCFRDFGDAVYCDYWFLMVTEGISRIENMVQDFAIAHYEFGKVLMIVHGKDSIDKAIQDGSRFFWNVYVTGKLLYNRQFYVGGAASLPDGTASLSSSALPNQERLRQRFEEGMSRAEGFLQGAKELMTTKKYDVSAFMLHQAVEQCCIALIGFHMDYRCDIHNLNRLLMLCRCFSDIPDKLFITGMEEDKVVFDKLVKSYTFGRYGAGFVVTEVEIDLLNDKVSRLVRELAGKMILLTIQKDTVNLN